VDEAMSEPHDMPPPANHGDRYELLGEIARGSMGAVLRGRDRDLGRDIAIKVLLEKYADDPEVARRFIEEAQIGAQLQHPGIVPVYDVGRFGKQPFFTMKLVKGRTLADILAEMADPSPERPRLLAVVLQVAQTVAYAHARGVVHRCLEPAHIAVGAFGEVQVMDWGLAKVLPRDGVPDEGKASRERERPEETLGAPAYMPPEQALGDAVDERADVFGLGAILCEVLTGKPPYMGRSAEEVWRKAANGELADALARLDGCGAGPELVALTRACLSPEASERPRHAGAVAEALAAYLTGAQERLRQAELAYTEARGQAVGEAKRRRLALALAGTVLLALALGGGWLWDRAGRAARQAQPTQEVNDAPIGIHDEAVLANLSPEERERLSRLRAEMAELLKKALARAPKEGKK
jgi:serine/threonine-protein kinase